MMEQSISHSPIISPYIRLFNTVRNSIYDENQNNNASSDTLQVFIDSEAVNELLCSPEELIKVLAYYTEFSIAKHTGHFECYRLLHQIIHTNDGILLNYDIKALAILKERTPGYKLSNLATVDEIKTPSAKILYNLCSEYSFKGEFQFTPEQLKEIFNVKYTIAILTERILKPAKQLLDEMYRVGESHVTFDFKSNRSATGNGARTISIDFQIKERFWDDYLEYKKEERTLKIKRIIADNFIYNSNIINEQISYMDCYQINSLHTRINSLDSHPDRNSLSTSDILRHILVVEYGIRTDKVPAQEDLFKRPPTPREYKEEQIRKRKKELAAKRK